MSKSALKHSSKRPSFQKTSIREDQVRISFLKVAPSFDLSDTILNSGAALVAGVGFLLNAVPSRRGDRGCVQLRSPAVTPGSLGGGAAWPCPLRHLPRDLWGLICCCHLPLICEQAGMSLGERAGRGQRDA